MATIHISEADAARDFAGLLAHVRTGAEIVIESGTFPVALLHAPAPTRRSIEECIALLPTDSSAVMDEDFTRDVEAAVAGYADPLRPRMAIWLQCDVAGSARAGVGYVLHWLKS